MCHYNTYFGSNQWSFMDGFSSYYQILMALEDMEKNSFITIWGTYYYRVMQFGLKSVRTTCQRATTMLFHDIMHQDIKVYVVDMIVKSRDRGDHLETLKIFFERIKKFKLRLNPKKWTFGVTFGKLLGYMVNKRGIEANLNKIRGFMDKLQYISRFIAILTEICESIFQFLRKSQPIV